MPYSRGLWQEFRVKWRQGFIPNDEIEQAAIWFYLNRATFSGDQENGGFAIPSCTGRNPAMSFANAVKSLDSIVKRLEGVTIKCLDYKDCILRYDSPDTLFFVDPPYLNTEGYYGKGDFTHDDHYNLARLLNGVKGRVMITHYQNGLYDDLYRGWYKQAFAGFKGSHKARAGTGKPKTVEVLYTNFEPVYKQKRLFKNT